MTIFIGGHSTGLSVVPDDPAGYTALTDWLRCFGTLERVGIEGTGTYTAALARHLAAAEVTVLEVDRVAPQSRLAWPGNGRHRAARM